MTQPPAKPIEWRDLYFLAFAGVIRLLRMLRARRLNEAAARAAGFAAYHFSIPKRRRVEANLERRLGHRGSLAARERIVRRVFSETWREFFAWADPDVIDQHSRPVDVEGFEHLQRALEAGHGAILWESNGFGPRKLMKRVLRGRGIALHQLHGSMDLGGFLLVDSPSALARRILRPYFDRCEKRFVEDTVYIPESNSLAFARTLIGRLHGANVLCVPGDGQLGRHRVYCELLGAPFAFATGAVSLARLANAPLLPVFCVETGGRARVIIEAALPLPRGIDRDAGFESSLGQYAQLLDQYVRTYPEQYRNWHLL